jgi:polyferredoxin
VNWKTALRRINWKFMLRWGVRLGLFAFIGWGAAIADTKAVSYALIFVAPLIIGAVACGWACPAGLVQDVLFRKKLALEVPARAHKILRITRYVFAVLFITGAFALPAAVQRSIGGMARLEFTPGIGLWLALASAAASIFINRFFCRYLCPFGAISGVKSLVRPATINRDESRCVKCGACDRACPMKIAMSKARSSCSPNCIDCFKCIESCPKRALYIGARNYLKP